jgi:hypothetical protein
MVNAGSFLQLRITPDIGESWTGIFAAGDEAAATRILSCPDPHWLCVISHGAVYLVDSRNPRHWREPGIFPVEHALAAPDAGLLLLAGFTDVEAWSMGGLVWRSARISVDGLRSLRVEGAQLRGEGWYPDCWEEFTLDLRTGKHQGGSDLSGW